MNISHQVLHFHPSIILVRVRCFGWVFRFVCRYFDISVLQLAAVLVQDRISGHGLYRINTRYQVVCSTYRYVLRSIWFIIVGKYQVIVFVCMCYEYKVANGMPRRCMNTLSGNVRECLAINSRDAFKISQVRSDRDMRCFGV